MALSIFKEIKSRNNNCYAITFDIHSFYDYIDHRELYKQWANILNMAKLPPDHFNIYKSLTRYCFVDLKEICYYVNSTLKGKNCKLTNCNQCKKNPYNQIPTTLFKNVKEFRYFREWYKETYKNTDHKNFYKNPGLSDKNFPHGIPQGSPMSAVLSNIYMLPFDLKMKKLANKINGVYRRYCDDIIFICPHKDCIKEQVIKKVQQGIEERGIHLRVHPINEWDPYSKSQCYDFKNTEKIKTLPLQYLGFYFNGQQVRIREASLARYLRKSNRAVIAMKLSAQKKLINMHKNGIILQNKQKNLYKRKLYERYTYLGKHNFIAYVLRCAENVFCTDDFDCTKALKHQIHKHKKRLDALIEKANKEILETFDNLTEDKNN